MKSLLVGLSLVFSQMAFAGIDWQTYSQEAFDQAQNNGQKVVLGFHKKGCGTCHAQDEALVDAGINEASNTVFLKVQRKNPDHTKTYEKYGYSSRQWAAILLIKDNKKVAEVRPGTTSGKQIQNLAAKARN